MTQEEKELLFKDLCSRLPYRPIVHAKWSYRETDGTIKHNEADRKLEINDFYAIWDVRPYLRPMSSMTGKEKDTLQLLHDVICDENYGDGYSPTAWDTITEWEDYCNSRHFDYRGLIEKGLALEAPEGMYNIK